MQFAGKHIRAGQKVDLQLEVSTSYSGTPVYLPFRVWRGPQSGPTVFVSAAVHGDELNGTGIVRELMLNPPFELIRGTLVLVPVINMLGFERHTRYLPDRRDLNRSFPGSATGSLARRFAHSVFSEILSKCDYGIDLHSAALRRTNFANIRADLRDPQVKRMAFAFGCELIVNGKGPLGSLRRSCVDAGCPTIILEAGEVWKIEPSVVDCGVAGITNVLIELGLVEGQPTRPAYQVRIDKKKWIRADCGGMLQFHVAPGDVVEKGHALATNSDLIGHEQNVLLSPVDGIVLGMTTLPSVKPGDPICHLAIPKKGLKAVRDALARTDDNDIHEKLRDDLATSIRVTPESAP